MIATLDSRLGRVTMYRLVWLVLAALFVIALGYAAFGALVYTPLELLCSAIVAIGVTTLVSWALARAVGTRAHLESSLITGFLLTFLLFPTADPTSLVTIAIVAAIAGASKFVIAWRGRHIFNPAAFAVFLISLIYSITTAIGAAPIPVLSTAAVWWVASGALWPYVILGALIVVARTKNWSVVGLYVLVAVVVSALRLSQNGLGLGEALGQVITAYPFVFAGAFMLTEPLTQAPKRSQRLLLAVVAALLATLPIQFGVFYASPELGLVVANLIAFLLGQRRGIRLALVGTRRLSPEIAEYTFEPARPVRFSAGQYLELHLPHRADGRGSRRTFSIASAPAAGTLAVATRLPEKSSSFKRELAAVESGATLRATAVGGDFVLPRDRKVPLLLVAGGIGITPFASQIAQLRATGHRRDIVLVYAVSDPAEIAYRELLEYAGVRVVLACRGETGPLPEGWSRIDGRITAETLREAVPDAAGRRGYISGSPAMVAALRPVLRAVGVKRVHTDAFSGY
ncbi:RnfABCDGE type electron transport complex subunit D [Microbacteriaceae bacterium VKM Ac-2854]|nr:RnfABCDGE type electron transport complex subunit D [Microbacteriaceae bacterium VKM Ac-2854]